MSSPVTISSPYGGIDWDTVEATKAQFHTHTNRPKYGDGHNGSDDAHTIVDFYADEGFNVLTLGDHEGRVDALTWPWTDLSAIESDWADRYPLGTHEDAGPDDVMVPMVAVKGIELGRGNEPEDMVSLFSDLETSPSGDNVAVLEEVAEREGIAWIAHPSRYATADDWGDRWWREALQTVDACLGLELYNSGYDRTESAAIWDAALSELFPERQVWAFAGDDLHSTEAQGGPRAWQTLLVDKLDRDSVRSALENGESFAHIVTDEDSAGTPPNIQSVTVDHDAGTATVDADDDASVEWVSSGTVVGTDPTIRIDETHVPYLRAVVTNDRGETSTQPITVS